MRDILIDEFSKKYIEEDKPQPLTETFFDELFHKVNDMTEMHKYTSTGSCCTLIVV